jgi:DNA-binding MarR family transcriptional regulator
MDTGEELDHLDQMLERWAREIPDMDPLTEGIVERIQTLARSFDRSLDETLAETQLDRRAFNLLGRLMSHGAPYQMTPGALAASMRLSSGAMTNRLDRVEASGLIRRLPDPTDRRGTLVEPTEAGLAAWDRTVGLQARREAMIASVLDEADRRELHRLLRHLMRAFPNAWGSSHPTPGSEDAPGATDATQETAPSID